MKINKKEIAKELKTILNKYLFYINYDIGKGFKLSRNEWCIFPMLDDTSEENEDGCLGTPWYQGLSVDTSDVDFTTIEKEILSSYGFTKDEIKKDKERAWELTKQLGEDKFFYIMGYASFEEICKEIDKRCEEHPDVPEEMVVNGKLYRLVK